MQAVRNVIYRRVLVIGIIMMMVFPIVGIQKQAFSVHERMQAQAQPEQLWGGLVKHEWQYFVEQRFLMQMGSSRAFLILLYNEIKYRLFPTRPNDGLIWTPEFGYYLVDSIRRLNGDVLRHEAVKQHYQRAAGRLRILQEMLGRHGVTLLVVTPPPKARVNPEYISPYLVSPPDGIMGQAISYGEVLERSGVNVLDVRHIFSEKKASSPWPFFTTTSFHWSFWAACGVTDEIMRKAQVLSGLSFFRIDCSDVDYGKSKGADTDIAPILNIFSTDALVGQAPFPKIAPQKNSLQESRKIIVIGDSFSDQIVYALTLALPDMGWSPGWLTRYDSFVSRQTLGVGGKVTSQAPLHEAAALSEILMKELLLMVVSDGNVYRDADNLNQMEFGATRVLLERLLTKADSGVIEPKNFLVQGWRTVDNKQWLTNGHLASVAIRTPASGKRVKLLLDLENLAPNLGKPRLLDIFLDGEPQGRATMSHGRRGELALTLPDNVKWKDSLVTEISLRDAFGQPLDLLLHGAQVAGVDQDKTVNKVSVIKDAALVKPTKPEGMRSINLISKEEPEEVWVEGLSELESNGKDSWRWALGPATRVKFYLAPALPDQARQVLLKFAFKNGVPIPDQSVTIRLNGADFRRFSSEEIAMHELTDLNVVLAAKKGVNVLEIIYQDWNNGKKNYGPHDPRKLAVVVMRLSLQSVNN